MPPGRPSPVLFVSPLSCFALLVSLALTACGTNVNLGGGGDAGLPDSRSPTCATFAAPTTSAPCSACSASSKSCQANGCFGGYFCDVTEKDCKAPGTPCTGSGS